MKLKNILHTGSAVAVMVMVTGCTQATLDKLENVGKAPQFKPVASEFGQHAPVVWPTGKVSKKSASTVNSLWDERSSRMFADSRARKVGDILTVKVELKEKAELDNKTERKRSNKDSMSAGSIFGLQDLLTGWLPGAANPTSLLAINGSMDNSGEGVIEREEEIAFDVAAVVSQVLDNGNILIYGSQEIRVNHEIRQITVEGVVRPGDIDAQNVVDSKRIAEARISYGGKGLISDVQQPRLGTQMVDILSPF
jgi:flagellar L-ring protein precursor FlgH